MLNVANVVMLPVANLSQRPYWKLEIETGNTCTMATFTTPLRSAPKIMLSANHDTAADFHTLLEVQSYTSIP